MEAGFITPSALHYVRNHGAVPKCEWATHTLTVDGLATSRHVHDGRPAGDAGARDPDHAGVRGEPAEEENLTAQTIGFNWGAAGHGCRCGRVCCCATCCSAASRRRSRGRTTCASSARSRCRRGGTARRSCGTRRWTRDVMLAYEQNGEKLMLDHGYPLRLVIPGFIGGRMIKLTEISVTEKRHNYSTSTTTACSPSTSPPRSPPPRGGGTARLHHQRPQHQLGGLSPDHEEASPSWGRRTRSRHAANGGGGR